MGPTFAGRMKAGSESMDGLVRADFLDSNQLGALTRVRQRLQGIHRQ